VLTSFPQADDSHKVPLLLRSLRPFFAPSAVKKGLISPAPPKKL
jgi:hypothetical protein